MQDFDKARLQRIIDDRRFQIGGETFTRVASVRPEVLIDWSNMDEDTSAEETVAIYDSVILRLVEDEDGAEKWARVRTIDGNEAVSIFDIRSVIEYLIEGLGARPLDLSSASSPTSTTPNGATPSTPVSSSPATPEQTPSA